MGVAFGLGGSATEAFAGPPGPEGIPLEVGAPIAPEASAASGQTVRGIQCDAGEQVVYHVHAHLAIYINGVLRPVPPGIGIVSPAAQTTAEGPFYEATQCYYWLHVHAQDGIIHIESPTVRGYTLGDFFAIWAQPLSSAQVGPVTGRLSVFVDGRRYYANPANIPLRSHEDIQIDVGTPIVPPQDDRLGSHQPLMHLLMRHARTTAWWAILGANGRVWEAARAGTPVGSVG